LRETACAAEEGKRMKNEIDKDFYCGAGAYTPEAEAGSTCPIRLSSCREECVCRHRKYPTPEQFRQEYGEEYPYDGAVYVLFETAISCNWVAALYADAKWMII
jgi:hypothetical protein